MRIAIVWAIAAAGVLVLVLAGVCGGCGAGVGTAPGAGAARIAAGSGPVDAGVPDEPADDPACAGAGEGERMVVPAGGSATARLGLTFRFAGTAHDSYDDGTTDLLLQLELLDGRAGTPISGWMPSAFGKPAYRVFGGFCVRVREASEERVVLDVAAAEDPAARPLPPCSEACCPPELRGPGPDGTVECCFCEGME